MTIPDEDEQKLVASLEALNTQTQGVWDFDTFSAADVDRCFLSGKFETAYRLLAIAEGAFERIRNAPRDEPMRCLTCDTAFRDPRLPEVIVVLTPSHPEPQAMLLQLLCRRCAAGFATHEDAQAAVIAALRRDLGWNARVMHISPGGNA